MLSEETHFIVTEDVCIRSTHLPQFGDYAYVNEIAISKEAFIECYNKWIKGEEEP